MKPISMNFVRVFSIAAFALLCGCEDGFNPRDVIPRTMFYVASTSMEPNLKQDTQLFADKIGPADVKRGDILIVRSDRGEDYVVRLIGLPGDAIELRNGSVILNGEPVSRNVVDTYTYEYTPLEGMEPVTVEALKWRETLPGSGSSYTVLDEGETVLDNFAEVRLSDDEYFFLGDNRDKSADSRAGPELGGLGIVSGTKIVRKADLSSVRR